MKGKTRDLRHIQPASEPTLDQVLRRIIREEIRDALAELAAPAPAKTHVSSSELMEALSISRGTLRGMMAEGLPYTKPGKYPRFALAEVDAWLARRRPK